MGCVCGKKNAQKKQQRKEDKAAVCIQRYVRGYLTRLRFRELVHRTKVAGEILKTEESYVDCLKLIVEHFLVPLREAAKKNQLITQDQVKTIFSVVEVIYNFQREILMKLTERMKSWSYEQKLGDLFLEMAPVLMVYSQYGNNYKKALTTFYKCREENQDFNAFIKEAEKHPSCKPRRFESLLIMPVQRIPRYVLLLQEILKRTRNDHVDYELLTSALQKIQEIAEVINSRQEDWERFNNLVHLYNSLQPKLEGLLLPHRRLLYEGEIRIGKKNSQRHYAIFNDMLLMMKPLPTGKLKPKECFHFVDITFIQDNGDSNIIKITFVKKSPLLLIADETKKKVEFLQQLYHCRQLTPSSSYDTTRT